MAQYHFIGGDGKPYGPYTLDQMKEHQAGNRLNADTQVSVDGGDWQPAGAIPELATVPVGAPGGIPQAPVAAGNAQAMVNGPGIFMMVLAIITILFSLIGILAQGAMSSFFLSIIPPDVPEEVKAKLIAQTAGGIFQNAVIIVINIVILIGAIKMRKCQSYGLAMTASILCLLCDCCGCCGLGLGAGIWSLIVLSKPEVKAAFQQRA